MRMCVRSGALADANYILKSLFSSEFPQPPTTTRKHLPHKPFIPLQFGKSVSPQLTAHTLLHELLRVGLTQKAYVVAQNLISSNFIIHRRTMNAVINRLLAQSSTPPNPLSHLRIPSMMKLFSSSQVLHLHPRLIADPSTRYAARLIHRSQHHRQRCSAEALESLIRYLLRRSEILFASLFVCMLVRDYQVRQAMAARLRGDIHACDNMEGTEQPPPERKALLQSRLKDVLWHKATLDKTLVCNVVGSIQNSMLKDPENEPDDLSLRVSLQALANIAMLLDERKLHFGEIAPILRALYSCPRSNTKVWVQRNGRAVHVEAYTYFHDVIMRLASNLPTVKPLRRLKPSDPTPTAILPPLDLIAYNTLLHYALRHRHDTVLAAKILHHMQTLQRHLQPDIVTHNILLRSGTLLTINGMAEEALSSLRQHQTNASHGNTPNPTDVAAKVDHEPEQQILHQETDARVPVAVCSDQSVEPGPRLPPTPSADAHTLTSYIMHLTSTGRPHVVTEILFDILPELTTIDHPSWGQMTREEVKALKKRRIKSRKQYLLRAASFGPRLFVALLNALCKAGRTGLCERVWLLAKKAELVSWRTRNIQPWLLPVHAYTIMLQCYAAEARRGLAFRRAGNFAGNDLQHEWNPVSKRYVRGWARFIQAQQTPLPRNTLRATAGRKIGMLLFHSMQDGGKEVFKGLLRLKGRQAKSVAVPRPDARFFNAALALFPSGYNQSYSRRYFKRRMRKATVQYAKGGAVSGQWNAMINTVAREMIQHGYSVPIGIRPLLLGRWPNGAFVRPQGRTLDQRPYAFQLLYPHMRSIFRAHSLFTMKTRGLPERKRTRQMRQRSKDCIISCAHND